MDRKPCVCCQGKKTNVGNGNVGWGFNRLSGEAREWAVNNRFSRSEYCVPVKDGKKFGGKRWLKDKCGDGRMGFSTRRKGQEDVSMEVGLDGQLKKRRYSLVKPKSSRATASRRGRRIDGSKCGLVSLIQITESQRDPVVVAQGRKIARKMKRARNRNRSAARGWKRVMRDIELTVHNC